MKCLNFIFLSLCLLISACTNVPVVTSTATGNQSTPTQWIPPTLALSPTPTPVETLAPLSPSATLQPTFPPMATLTHSDLGKLAYVQGGDIWVKALPDGQPLRLTTDGHNREPRWPPSGQWIAFRDSDARVWVIRADGSGGRLLDADTSIGVYAWAPTIDRLVYTANDGTLLAENADGTDRQAFLMPDNHQPITGVQSLAWSPDGQWLALTRSEILKQGAPPDRYDSVWRVRADGTEARELFNGGRPSDREFSLAGWISDSSMILLWINPSHSASILADGVPLYALPVEGGSPIQLAAGLGTGDGPRQGIVLLHPDFIAPARANFDASQLAVTVGGYRGTWTNKGVGLVNVQTGGIRLLTPKDQAAFSPDWSPTGALAYVAMPDTGDLVGGEDARLGLLKRRIYLVKTQGDPQPQPLTHDPAYRDERPLWSADGSFIVFARMDRENRSSVWLIPSAGGAPQQIVEALTPAPEWFGYYGYIDWNDWFDWWRGTGGPTASSDTPTNGSSVCGQVIAGYGDHRPVSGLPFWIGETSAGEPAAYTSAEGYLTLTNMPTGTVHIVDDHLAFQVTILRAGLAVNVGQLKYPLIHPPTYYIQSPTSLSDVQVSLDKGQSIDFTSCLVDADWQRPTRHDQTDHVWSKRPFSAASTDWLQWWFDQPAMIYDTIDHFSQSFPDGPNLDSLLADGGITLLV